jgi:hypothetical protein
MNRGVFGPALVLVAALSTIGCDKDEGATADDKESGAARDAVEKAVFDAADKAGASFVKGMAKKSCEILTPALVAKEFDVPEKELKQLKVMGCIYSWKEKSDGETKTTLEANLTLMRVHETVDAAKTWFKNSTANKTGEELNAEMKQVTDKTKEHESIDTEMKKKTVGQMGSIMAEAMKDGTTYEAIDGVGDEAKVALRDGAVWVRVGNLTFTTNAYKGPPQPKPKLDMKDMRNIKKIASQSMEAQKKWLEETHAERRAASIRLAKLVLGGLE